jgi:hypothetical protein
MVSEGRHTRLPSGCVESCAAAESGLRQTNECGVPVKCHGGITRIDETILDIGAARTSHGYSGATTARAGCPGVPS